MRHENPVVRGFWWVVLMGVIFLGVMAFVNGCGGGNALTVACDIDPLPTSVDMAGATLVGCGGPGEACCGQRGSDVCDPAQGVRCADSVDGGRVCAWAASCH